MKVCLLWEEPSFDMRHNQVFIPTHHLNTCGKFYNTWSFSFVIL